MDVKCFDYKKPMTVNYLEGEYDFWSYSKEEVEFSLIVGENDEDIAQFYTSLSISDRKCIEHMVKNKDSLFHHADTISTELVDLLFQYDCLTVKKFFETYVIIYTFNCYGEETKDTEISLQSEVEKLFNEVRNYVSIGSIDLTVVKY